MKNLLKAVCSRLTGRGGVPNPGDFVSPDLIPSVPVRIAALDGENSDLANGLTLEGAYGIWGELAYRLAGAGGYERVRESDRQRVAPGAETIRELFGGQPGQAGTAISL